MNQEKKNTISGADILAAAEKRTEKQNEKIKEAIIAHLNLINPSYLLSLYTIVRALARKD